MIDVSGFALRLGVAARFVASRLALLVLAVALSVVAFAGASPRLASAEWDVETASFLVLLNEYRAQNGAGPLAVDAKLQAASDWMANDQLNTKRCTQQVPFTCEHTDTLGRNPTARATQQFGWPLTHPVSENLFWGGDTAKQALEGWKSSPGHNANMLNPNWVATGIGKICNGRSCMWAQKFTSLLSEPFAAPPAAQANFTGAWTAQFPNGRTAAGPVVEKGPLTLTQQGDQVTGTLAISLKTYRPLTGADVVTIQGRVVAGTPKVVGTFTQPASNGFEAVNGDIELTLQPNGVMTAFLRNANQFWRMTESPRAEAAPPPPPPPAQPTVTPQPTATTVPNPIIPAEVPANPVTQPEVPANTMTPPVEPVNPANPPEFPVEFPADPPMDPGNEMDVDMGVEE